ncbi:hypothetical protein Y032_0091g2504 [Ancylostoma ceylanicum]|uniref:Uncharacterized protein n=1 Tax=Ancylostoma ceylanicum TaxID=53326 RepID=A0A016TLQ0_9BILA|nr:hypothetical protein Y032_0091g2504 [Ancylostoma ceylanicum]
MPICIPICMVIATGYAKMKPSQIWSTEVIITMKSKLLFLFPEHFLEWGWQNTRNVIREMLRHHFLLARCSNQKIVPKIFDEVARYPFGFFFKIQLCRNLVTVRENIFFDLTGVPYIKVLCILECVSTSILH